jgi:hypothetical protein
MMRGKHIGWLLPLAAGFWHYWECDIMIGRELIGA